MYYNIKFVVCKISHRRSKKKLTSKTKNKYIKMRMTKIEFKRLAKRVKYCINQCLSSCTRNVIISVFYFTTFVPNAEFMQFQLVGYHYVRVSTLTSLVLTTFIIIIYYHLKHDIIRLRRL